MIVANRTVDQFKRVLYEAIVREFIYQFEVTDDQVVNDIEQSVLVWSENSTEPKTPGALEAMQDALSEVKLEVRQMIRDGKRLLNDDP